MELAVIIIGLFMGYLLYRLADRTKTAQPSIKGRVAIEVWPMEGGGWSWALRSFDSELPLSEGRADSELEARSQAAKAWARSQGS